MREFDKVIVSCAVTGAIHVPSMSSHLPVTPDEIAAEAIAAARAGASIIHLHVRDPETGEPTSDLDLYRRVAGEIATECDVIVQPTTGGAVTMSVEERAKVVPALEPEMASCNMGSMNFGLYPILDGVDEFDHEWEPEFLESTRGNIFPNTFEDIETLSELFSDAGTKPELECYDVGHLYNARHLVDRGVVEPPIHVQFVMGVLGGIGAETGHLEHMLETAERLFGDEFSVSVVGAGRMQFPLGVHNVVNGGHVRVGLEDSLYLSAGKLAESNAAQVEKIVHLVDELTGREIATPAETREFLGLKGQENVNF